MRGASGLSIVLVGTIVMQVAFFGVNCNYHDKWSLTEPGVRCGTVPMELQLASISTKTIAQHDEPHPDPGQGRILYGQDAKFGEWPWIVHLDVDTGDSRGPSVCSGTLINSRWIITAGHCGVHGPPSRWKATFGLYNIDRPDPGAIEAQIDKVIVHPNYYKLNNDVTLLRLAKPIAYNLYIQPICLIAPTVDLVSYAQNKTCIALGYGRLANNELPLKLQKLRVVVYETSECVADLGRNGKLREGAACTGPMQGIGATCRGDSGGPNVCYNSQADRWELFGSVSYGPKKCDRVEGDKWLTAVADIRRYVGWIHDTVEGDGGDGEESPPEPVGDDPDTSRDDDEGESKVDD